MNIFSTGILKESRPYKLSQMAQYFYGIIVFIIITVAENGNIRNYLDTFIYSMFKCCFVRKIMKTYKLYTNYYRSTHKLQNEVS